MIILGISKFCIATSLFPTIKNKNKNAHDVNNYRPIPVTTVVLKLFESYMLHPVMVLIGETGARSKTFFSFCYFSHNKFFSNLFNMKNLDHCLTNIKKIN